MNIYVYDYSFLSILFFDQFDGKLLLSQALNDLHHFLS